MVIKKEYNVRVYEDYIPDTCDKAPNGVIIEQLKSELSESDYKVAKIAECTALGLPMPYDVEQLHKERQALRDRINELEGGVQ